ncbi:MAG: nitroreductase family protein [Sphaerochaetaceae bacterium]|nr:nitroreductase family protein [Sphaerochaetaceae bacterium]
MDIFTAMRDRHSVRSYDDRPIPDDLRKTLQAEIDACNAAGDLRIQLMTDEPEAFGGMMAHYGKFSDVRNYLVMIGPKNADLDEKAGYYGERLVLKAQMLGLNTCWVALTFSRSRPKKLVVPGDKLVCVIALGYGVTQGVPHKSKPMERLYKVDGVMPDWFRRGMDTALLAPTAVNQQKFRFSLADKGAVVAESTGGAYSMIDLGIVKYHFEVGAGKDMFHWA